VTSSLTGNLLIAAPGVLEDPNFRRTVVLLLEHGEQGALGVVLNRPSDTPVLDPFPGWDDVATSPSVLFMGGPVSQQMIIALAKPRPGAEPEGWHQVLRGDFGRLGTVDLSRGPLELATDLDQLRVFAGYAGWSGGQLEGEIDAGAWFVVGAEPWDPFCADPDDLWRDVLRRQPPPTAYYANYPADPSLN
jgi:putative transcriptional regulator